MKIPRLFGDYADTDTQFIQKLKQYQEWMFVGLCGLGIAFVFMIVMTFTGNAQGTWRFALCKVFLERNVQYPTDVKILFAGEKQTAAQIGYMVTNSFGSRQSELMECFYNIEPSGVRLNKVTIDRTPLEQDKIDAFNETINVLLISKDLDKTLPPLLPSSLEDLKQD